MLHKSACAVEALISVEGLPSRRPALILTESQMFLVELEHLPSATIVNLTHKPCLSPGAPCSPCADTCHTQCSSRPRKCLRFCCAIRRDGLSCQHLSPHEAFSHAMSMRITHKTTLARKTSSCARCIVSISSTNSSQFCSLDHLRSI